ncbi:MAG: AAA family ATPase, partial [Thermoplasmata archaeon]
MKLIVTVGMPGSGKDELVEVARQMGLATLKMGDLVREETRRRGLPLTNANVSRVANEDRERHGAGIWAQRVLPKLTETKMLVDGCRSDTELSVFRHYLLDFFVLW